MILLMYYLWVWMMSIASFSKMKQTIDVLFSMCLSIFLLILSFSWRNSDRLFFLILEYRCSSLCVWWQKVRWGGCCTIVQIFSNVYQWSLVYCSFRFCKKKVCSCVDVRSLCPTAFFNALLLVSINLSLKPAIQGDNFTMNVHLIPSLAIYDVTDSSVMTLFHASSTVVFDNMNCEA